MLHSISAQCSHTLLSLCIDKSIASHDSIDKIRSSISALLMSALTTERITQYQILQLLNCLEKNIYSDILPLKTSLRRRLDVYIYYIF